MERPVASKLAGGARQMGKTGLVSSRIGYGAMELAGAPKAGAIDGNATRVGSSIR